MPINATYMLTMYRLFLPHEESEIFTDPFKMITGNTYMNTFFCSTPYFSSI
jgi:hypothetical protein